MQPIPPGGGQPPDDAETAIGKEVTCFPDNQQLWLKWIEFAIGRGDNKVAAERWLQAVNVLPAVDIGIIYKGARVFFEILLLKDTCYLVNQIWIVFLSQPREYANSLAHEIMWLSVKNEALFNVIRQYALDFFSARTAAGPDEASSRFFRLCFCADQCPDSPGVREDLKTAAVEFDLSMLSKVLDSRVNPNNRLRMQEVVREIDTSGIALTAEQTYVLSAFAWTFDADLAYRLIARCADGNPEIRPLSDPLGMLREIRNRRCEGISRRHAKSGSNAHRKLRIAVCVSGQLRGYKAALETLPVFGFADHDADLFVHTWRNTGQRFPAPVHADRMLSGEFLRAYRTIFQNSWAEQIRSAYPNFSGLYEKRSIVTRENLCRDYKTDYVVVEDDNDEAFASLSNSQKMYYKVQSCFRLAEAVGREYDLVVRIRPDKGVDGTLNAQWRDVLDDLRNDRTILVDLPAALHFWVPLVVGDQIGIGDWDTMSRYCRTYDITLQAISENHFGFPKDFYGHGNFAFGCFSGGIATRPMYEKLGVYGSHLFDNAQPTASEVLLALKQDIGPIARNSDDRVLLAALETDLGIS